MVQNVVALLFNSPLLLPSGSSFNTRDNDPPPNLQQPLPHFHTSCKFQCIWSYSERQPIVMPGKLLGNQKMS
jgi:hypothetical protein